MRERSARPVEFHASAACTAPQPSCPTMTSCVLRYMPRIARLPGTLRRHNVTRYTNDRTGRQFHIENSATSGTHKSLNRE